MKPRPTQLPLAALSTLAALLAAGCVSNGPRPDVHRVEHGYYGHSSPVIVYSPPPPPPLRVEVVPPPRPGYLWVPGRWAWEKDRHRWVEGRWQAQPGPRIGPPSLPAPIVIRQQMPAPRPAMDGPRGERPLPAPPVRHVVVAETRRDAAQLPAATEPAHGRVREEHFRHQGAPGEKEGRPQRKERRPDGEQIPGRRYDGR